MMMNGAAQGGIPQNNMMSHANVGVSLSLNECLSF